MGGVATIIDEAAIMAVLEPVPDPEIPVLSIIDLGIVRGIAQRPATGAGQPDLHRMPGDRSRSRMRSATPSTLPAGATC